jgi:predicted RNA methylase
MSIESSNDPQGFVSFEHSGWEAVSRGYEQHFTGLTSQSVAAVLDAAEVKSGKQVLDVCCGPGIITAAATARGAQTTGIDFSAAVVEIANLTLNHCHMLITALMQWCVALELFMCQIRKKRCPKCIACLNPRDALRLVSGNHQIQTTALDCFMAR